MQTPGIWNFKVEGKTPQMCSSKASCYTLGYNAINKVAKMENKTKQTQPQLQIGSPLSAPKYQLLSNISYQVCSSLLITNEVFLA